MLDVKAILTKREAEQRQKAADRLRKFFAKGDSATEKDVVAAAEDCETLPELGTADWLQIFATARPLYAAAAKLADELDKRAAERAAAEQAALAAQNRLTEELRRLEGELADAKSRLHSAIRAQGEAQTAAQERDSLQAGFPALFDPSRTELLGNAQVATMPAAIRAALAAANLPRPVAQAETPQREEPLYLQCHQGPGSLPPQEQQLQRGWSATIS